MKKYFLVLVAGLCSLAATSQTKTYDFANASSFATDWTINANVPSGGTGKCEQVSSLKSFPTTSAPFMGFTFENKSGIVLTATTTASFQNITNISFRAVASDNSKPNWTVNIVDDNGTVLKTLLNKTDSKTTFNTGGTNKWGSWTGAVSPAVSGHLQFVLEATSSGKYAGLDDIVITYTGGSVTPDPTPGPNPQDTTTTPDPTPGPTPQDTTTTPDPTPGPGPGTDPVTPPTPPSTTLALHMPEVYEGDAAFGGYGTPLATYNGREYEVYYINRDVNGKLNLATTNVDKTANLSNGSDDKTFTAKDGWFTGNTNGRGGDTGFAATAEFGQSVHSAKLREGYAIEFHVKGYSEFAVVAKDNSTATTGNIKHTVVYIDGVEQTQTLDKDNYTIRRFALTTGEHVIRVTAVGASDSKVVAFSLRTAYVPKVKYLLGNDSTQKVRQTDAIKPITYFLKNRISDAVLSWDGPAANGITLQKAANDTLLISGTANCPNGVYRYIISAKDEADTIVSSLSGSFSVISEVKALGDSNIVVWRNSAMNPAEFRYYAFNEADVTCQWTSGTPAGLSMQKDAANKKVVISGTPTVAGTFPYTISVAGGNTINGILTVESNEPTIVPGASKTMLYLYKNNKNAGFFPYLSTQYSYFARPAGDAMQNASEYNSFDFIVISEDVDANNPEVLQIIKNLKKPVLNQKIFTYTTSRLGWGEPDNGSISNTRMHVVQSQHAIFTGLNGSDIEIISAVENNKGLMVANITEPGGYCLASAQMRGENYTDDGPFATFIHEVPASVRGAKYIALPIALNSAANLTNDGKKLLVNIVEYLCSNQAFSATIDLRITGFSVNGITAKIDEAKQEIWIDFPAGTDLTAVAPQVSLADSKAVVTPGNGETIDLSDLHYGVKYVVSDFINKRTYTVRARIANELEDLSASALHMDGLKLINEHNEWIHIYNAGGQLITLTNSDYDFTSMPSGIYLIASENGSFKVMR